jgi:hypothetical protein
MLPYIVSSYNNTVHSSIGIAPNKVNEKNQDQVWEFLYRKILEQKKTAKPKFKVGDRVRLSISKSTFQKGESNRLLLYLHPKPIQMSIYLGYLPRYTEEVFVVGSVNNTIPVTYRIQDLKDEQVKGSFYESELLKVVK